MTMSKYKSWHNLATTMSQCCVIRFVAVGSSERGNATCWIYFHGIWRQPTEASAGLRLF